MGWSGAGSDFSDDEPVTLPRQAVAGSDYGKAGEAGCTTGSIAANAGQMYAMRGNTAAPCSSGTATSSAARDGSGGGVERRCNAVDRNAVMRFIGVTEPDPSPKLFHDDDTDRIITSRCGLKRTGNGMSEMTMSVTACFGVFGISPSEAAS